MGFKEIRAVDCAYEILDDDVSEPSVAVSVGESGIKLTMRIDPVSLLLLPPPPLPQPVATKMQRRTKSNQKRAHMYVRSEQTDSRYDCSGAAGRPTQLLVTRGGDRRCSSFDGVSVAGSLTDRGWAIYG